MSERVRLYCLEDTARYIVDASWEVPSYAQGYTVDVDLATAEALLAGQRPATEYRTASQSESDT
jgi:hypothetical protein